MDKYEYNVRSEQILKLVAENDYKTAAKIADTIDWRRVRSVNMLTTVGEVYERSGRYEDAKDILLMAYEKAPIGRRLAYRLTEVCIHIGDFEEAQNYYKDFVNLSPKDNRKYELLYHLHKKQGAPAEMLVAILEEYKEHDMDERWAYELALCYHEAGMAESCVGQCNEIFLWFRDGEYVVKALELKSTYAPLTESQQEVMDAAMAAIAAAQAEAAALEAQRLAEIEAQKAAEIQAQRVAEIEAMKAAEAQRIAEEEAKRAAELQAKREAEEKARREAEAKRLEEEAAKKVEKPDLEGETDFSEEINGSTENDEEREAEEKITAQNMEEIYGEEEEFEVTPTFKKLSGDTIDIRKEQGIIRRNFVVEEEENKLSSVSDDQIEGQMTLAEILANYEKNNGWEVVDSDSTKKEIMPEEPAEEVIVEADVEPAEDIVEEAVEELSDDSVEETTVESVEEEVEESVVEVVQETKEDGEEESAAVDEELHTASSDMVEIGEEPEDLPDIESAEADTEAFFAEEENVVNEYEDVSVESISEAVERAADEMIHATESEWNEESGLTYEQKEIFHRFLFMKGMEEQLTLLFRDVATAKLSNNSASGNLLVVGEYKSGKTTLAIDVMKEINRIQERKGRKIAKISGERLNYKGLRETFSHLQDADLLVEHAGRMSKATLQGLLRFMGGETGGMLIVFEDTKEGMEYILTQVPEARAYFSYYLELKEVEISEWVDLARQYAKEKNYKIDDMAKLALSARIAEVSHDTPIIEFEDVQEIVDAAIRRYNRKHFFKKNKKDEDSYLVLKEADFK